MKQEVFALLNQIGAKEPYMAYLSQSIVEVYVTKQEQDPNLPQGFRQVREAIRQGMEGRRSQELLDHALALWEEYACLCAPDFHYHPREGSLGGGYGIYRLQKRRQERGARARFCRAYGIGIALFNKHLARMSEKLKEQEDAEQD